MRFGPLVNGHTLEPKTVVSAPDTNVFLSLASEIVVVDCASVAVKTDAAEAYSDTYDE